MEFRRMRVGYVKEENFVLSLQDTEQSSARHHLSVRRKPNMMEFVPHRAWTIDICSCDDVAVGRRVVVEIDYCQEIGRFSRLISSTNEHVLPGVFPLIRCGSCDAAHSRDKHKSRQRNTRHPRPAGAHSVHVPPLSHCSARGLGHGAFLATERLEVLSVS